MTAPQLSVVRDEATAARVPSPDAVKAAVRAALPAIRARAQETEKRRSLPPENVAALRDAGLFRILQPRAFGGYELGFELLVECLIEVGAACTSTGWVCGQYAVHQWLSAGFPLQAQKDLWDRNPDAVLAVSYAPTGKAVAAEGGWRVTGRWAFASGVDTADWGLCAIALPPETEGGPPRPAFFVIPRSDYAIEEVWDTCGLAGTGSNTIVVEDAFVPSHRLLFFSEATSGRTPGSQVHTNPLYRQPLLSCVPASLAVASIGAATGALEAYVETTSVRTTRGAVAGGGNRMAEFPTIQLRVAEAAAAVDAARTILLRDLRTVAEKTRAGDALTKEERITIRRGQAFAVSLSIRAVEALNASTGGHGLALANPVQRAWRDANAVGRHISMNWDAVGTMYGQMALGLEPKGQY